MLAKVCVGLPAQAQGAPFSQVDVLTAQAHESTTRHCVCADRPSATLNWQHGSRVDDVVAQRWRVSCVVASARACVLVVEAVAEAAVEAAEEENAAEEEEVEEEETVGDEAIEMEAVEAGDVAAALVTPDKLVVALSSERAGQTNTAMQTSANERGVRRAPSGCGRLGQGMCVERLAVLLLAPSRVAQIGFRSNRQIPEEPLSKSEINSVLVDWRLIL